MSSEIIILWLCGIIGCGLVIYLLSLCSIGGLVIFEFIGELLSSILENIFE